MPEVGGYQPRDDEERHRHCQQADDHPREEAVPNMLPVRGQGNGLAIRRRDPHHLEVGCAPDVGHQRRLLELHYPSVLSHPDPARSAASEPWRAAAEAISWAVSATERLPSAMCSMASTTSWVEERCCWVASCTWPLTSVIARIIVSPRSICLTPFSSAITVSLLCACAPSTSLAIWAAGALERPASRVTDACEPAARVARARGLDRRVEREEVGLVGDVVDQVEDALDLVDTAGQRQRAIARSPEVGLRQLQVGLDLACLDGDSVDSVGDRGCGSRDLLHARRRGGCGGRLLKGRGGQ